MFVFFFNFLFSGHSALHSNILHSECLGGIIVRNFLHHFKQLLFQFRWLAKHDLEKQETSCKSSQFEEETPHTSCTNKHASSHKHTNSSHKCKSKMPPAVMYTWQYKYKVKKSLAKKRRVFLCSIRIIGKR